FVGVSRVPRSPRWRRAGARGGASEQKRQRERERPAQAKSPSRRDARYPDRIERSMLDCPEVSPVSESQSSSAPVYADRATGQTFGDARTMVNAYLMRFAARARMEVGKL